MTKLLTPGLTAISPGFHPAGHTAAKQEKHTYIIHRGHNSKQAIAILDQSTLSIDTSGHVNLPSPLWSVYWNAWTSRSVSSTDLPTYTHSHRHSRVSYDNARAPYWYVIHCNLSQYPLPVNDEESPMRIDRT